MLALNPGTEKRLRTLFPDPGEQAAVRAALEHVSGAGVASSDAELERVHAAILKVSGGKVHALHAALRLAKQDVRDLLVAAGFHLDERAHERWWP